MSTRNNGVQVPQDVKDILNTLADGLFDLVESLRAGRTVDYVATIEEHAALLGLLASGEWGAS